MLIADKKFEFQEANKPTTCILLQEFQEYKIIAKSKNTQLIKAVLNLKHE
jgi:hypothetical protein